MMKHSLIAAALLAVALTACGEKKAEETAAPAVEARLLLLRLLKLLLLLRLTLLLRQKHLLLLRQKHLLLLRQKHLLPSNPFYGKQKTGLRVGFLFSRNEITTLGG